MIKLVFKEKCVEFLSNYLLKHWSITILCLTFSFCINLFPSFSSIEMKFSSYQLRFIIIKWFWRFLSLLIDNLFFSRKFWEEIESGQHQCRSRKWVREQSIRFRSESRTREQSIRFRSEYRTRKQSIRFHSESRTRK